MFGGQLDARKGVTFLVEVRSRGANQAEVMRDLDPVIALVGVVGGTERLHPSEAIPAMTAQQLRTALAIQVRMGQCHPGTDGASDRERLDHAQLALHDIDGPSVIEMAAKRVFEGADRSARHHRPGQVGTTNRALAGRSEKRFPVDMHAALRQLGHHDAKSPSSRLAHFLESNQKLLPGPASVIGENMHRLAVVVAGQLDAAQRARAGHHGSVAAQAGIMIGESE